MAHKGKFYKLQFRRDLASTINNNFAYPEAVRWSSSNVQGAVALDIVNRQPLLLNLLREGQPPMVWTTGVETVAGISYVASLTIINPFETVGASLRFHVVDATSGIIYFDFSTTQKLSGASFAGWSGIGSPPFTDSPQYRIVGVGFQWDWQAVGYSAYDP